MARPSGYTKEIADEICERVANGESFRSICKDPNMPSFTTIWRWQDENEEFRKLSARGRDWGTHNLADECLEIADREDLDPANKRVMIDTRIRLIGKWNSRAYGDKIGLTDGEGGPLQIVVKKFAPEQDGD